MPRANRHFLPGHIPEALSAFKSSTVQFAKATYRQRITHFTEKLDFLSEDDKDWIMGRAIVTRRG